jgi:hypothetical protein
MTVTEELTAYFITIQTFDKDMAQDGESLHSYIIELTNVMSRANFLMAEYGRKWREEKKAAYQKLAASSEAQKKYYAASLAKDYIDSQCSESAYVYDLSERLSRTCVHTIDGIRTVISSLKSEREFSKYQM